MSSKCKYTPLLSIYQDMPYLVNIDQDKANANNTVNEYCFAIRVKFNQSNKYWHIQESLC